MTAAHKDFDVVELTRDIPEEGLAKGALGTVIFVHKEGEAYIVEFCDDQGRTLADPTLKAADLKSAEMTSPH